MPKNMGSVDRVVRISIAVAIAILYFTGTINGTLAIVLGIVAIAFLVTSLMSRCPIYLPFHLSTKRRV